MAYKITVPIDRTGDMQLPVDVYVKMVPNFTHIDKGYFSATPSYYLSEQSYTDKHNELNPLFFDKYKEYVDNGNNIYKGGAVFAKIPNEEAIDTLVKINVIELLILESIFGVGNVTQV